MRPIRQGGLRRGSRLDGALTDQQLFCANVKIEYYFRTIKRVLLETAAGRSGQSLADLSAVSPCGRCGRFGVWRVLSHSHISRW